MIQQPGVGGEGLIKSKEIIGNTANFYEKLEKRYD